LGGRIIGILGLFLPMAGFNTGNPHRCPTGRPKLKLPGNQSAFKPRRKPTWRADPGHTQPTWSKPELKLKQFSVPTVLGIYTAWHRIPRNVLKMAIDRGNAVHAASQAYQENLFYSLPKDYQGYFKSFCKWFDRYVEKVLFTEKRFEDSVLGFNGKPDLGAKLKQPMFHSERKPDGYLYPIIDIKTGKVEGQTWCGQGAGYIHLANQEAPVFDCAIFLQVKETGDWPKVLIYEQTESDFSAFLSALNSYRYFKE
jgi:hypothetical protein